MCIQFRVKSFRIWQLEKRQSRMRALQNLQVAHSMICGL